MPLSDVRQVDSAAPVSSLRALLTSETHYQSIQWQSSYVARTCGINDVAPPGHGNSEFGACCAHNTDSGRK
jgi:hypothetical protein